MNSENFKLLQNKAKEDIKFDKDNVLQKSIEIPNLMRKYLDFWTDEFKAYKKLSIEFDKLYGEKYHYYQFDYSYKLDNVREIENAVKSDDDVYKKSLELADQETICKWCEKTVDIIKTAQFSIKNYLELQKWLSGC